MAKAAKVKQVKCRRCDAVGEYDPCEDCEDHFDHCYICSEYYPSDEGHRHLFWSNEQGSLMGCGVYEREWDDHKAAFFVLLRLTGLAQEIRAAMVAHDYHLQTMGCLIGGPESLFVYLCGKSYDHKFPLSQWVDELDEDDLEAVKIGGGWLLSLWSGPQPWHRKGRAWRKDSWMTPKADARTVEWIDEYLAQQPSAESTPAQLQAREE